MGELTLTVTWVFEHRAPVSRTFTRLHQSAVNRFISFLSITEDEYGEVDLRVEVR